MLNHSLPSHLLDWLWIELSTGPNGAAAEMIPSSIAASAYWRGWTLKAWRYFLSRLLQGVRKGSRTLLANSPDWLKAAPMRENLLASWRQFGQKQDHCPSLLDHNAKYKRLLPSYCDFANGVRSVSGSHNGVVFVPVRLEPLLRLNIM